MFFRGTLITIALGLGLGAAVLLLDRRRTIGDRVLLAALPLLIALIGVKTAQELYTAPSFVWSDARMAPVAGLLRGYGLYSGEREGSIQTTMYTPFASLAYLPAALAKEPASAMTLAAAAAMAYYYLPALVFFRRLARGPGAGPAAWILPAYGLVGLAIITHADPLGLNYSSSYIHADAPAIGLGLAACAAMIADGKGGTPGTGQALLALILGWLSCWSKQVMVPLLLTLHFWALVAYGRRFFLKFTLLGAAVGLLTCGAFVGAYGWEKMYLNAVVIPGRFPWRESSIPMPGRLDWSGPFPYNLAMSLLDTVNKGSFFLIVLAIRLIDRHAGAAGRPRGAGPRWFAANSWALPVLAALACLPTSAAGIVKWGGGPNSESPTFYLLAAGLLAMIIQDHVGSRGRPGSAGSIRHAGVIALAALAVKMIWASEARAYDLNLTLLCAAPTAALLHLASRPGSNRGRAGALVGAILAAAALTAAWSMTQGVLRMSNRLDFDPGYDRINYHSRAAYEYIRAHPGRAYFPCNPLAHVLAEKKLYHFLGSVSERYVVRLAVEPEHLRAHMPVDCEMVCYPVTIGMYGDGLKDLLPQYDVPINIPILPQFKCYRRKSPPAVADVRP